MNRRIHIDMQVSLPRGCTEVTDTKQTYTVDNRASGRVDNAKAPLRTFGSRELFNGSKEVAIEHGGALYRLKITRQGKLILNK